MLIRYSFAPFCKMSNAVPRESVITLHRESRARRPFLNHWNRSSSTYCAYASVATVLWRVDSEERSKETNSLSDGFRP